MNYSLLRVRKRKRYYATQQSADSHAHRS